MALSLGSIYKPLNGFFLHHFGAAPGSPVCFRFDQCPADLVERDYVDPALPPPGYHPAVALERWSQFVNAVPTEDPDGMRVVFATSAIDDFYGRRLLHASVPHVTDGTNPAAAASQLVSFGEVKAAALRRWDQAQQQSSTGMRPPFRPSVPSPLTWYDETNTGAWTSHAFSVNERASGPAPADAREHLWRLKISDFTMGQLLAQSEAESSPGHLVFRRIVDTAELAPSHQLLRSQVAATAVENPALARAGGGPRGVRDGAMRAASAGPVNRLNPAPVRATASAPRLNDHSFIIHDELRRRAGALDPWERLAVRTFLAPHGRTRPTAANSLQIAFDYCLVRIARPWLLDTFIHDNRWCIPGVARGQLTVPDAPGATLPLLPVGVVLVRNLTIASSWRAEDIATAGIATAFGPFAVDNALVNNRLSRAGIQVIGWMLQRMPPLPPHDPL